MANHFTSTYPRSPFVLNLTAQRSRAERRAILRNRDLVGPGGRRRPCVTTVRDPEHLLEVLASHFDLVSQNAVAVVSASGYANFHAGGVLLTVSGDANGNATAALEWRPAGGSFLPAQPLERIDATHFAGSLFDLAPGTSYEARVTLADPDGVAGSPVTAAFATRSEALAEPTLRTLYVSPSGDDGNPGTSPGAPLRTIQRAADLAQAGDLVLIQPGRLPRERERPALGHGRPAHRLPRERRGRDPRRGRRDDRGRRRRGRPRRAGRWSG